MAMVGSDGWLLGSLLRVVIACGQLWIKPHGLGKVLASVSGIAQPGPGNRAMQIDGTRWG